jgi:protein-tyrosine phosphatase
MTHSILFVCHGNTCRSPMAQGLMRHMLQQAERDSDFAIDSAGTHARNAGTAPDSRACEAASTRGADISDLRSRQAAANDITSHNLVLAMDEATRNELLGLAPEAAPGKVRLFLDFAPGYGLKDVPDPFHGNVDDYMQALDLIEGGCAGVITALLQPPTSSASKP